MLAFKASHSPKPKVIWQDDASDRVRKSPFDYPSVVAPYDRIPANAVSKCFDRKTGRQVLPDELDTYSAALAQYHLHPETKFQQGDYMHRGLTQRRHIFASELGNIGKEANRLEERAELEDRPELQIDYGTSPDAESRFMVRLKQAREVYGMRAIASKSGISARQLQNILNGNALPHPVNHKKLSFALFLLERDHRKSHAEITMFLKWITLKLETSDLVEQQEFSKLLGMRLPDLRKVVNGKRKPTQRALDVYRDALQS